MADQPSADLSAIDAEAAKLSASSSSSEVEPAAQDEARAFETRLSHDRSMRQMELGWFGRAFGYGDEKKGNVIAICIGACLGMIAILTIIPWGTTVSEKAVPSLISIVTLALGYLFGRREP